MPNDSATPAPPGVLRRIRTARSVLVNAALGEAFVRSLPFAGGLAIVSAASWYLAAGPLETAPAWLAPALVALAFLGIAAGGVLRRAQRLPGVLAAAVELDQSAKTHSALASSLEFAQSEPGPFEQWALANAIREAERGDLTMPTPPPIQGALPRLGIGAGLLALAISFVLIVPPRSWSTEAAAVATDATDPARITEAQQTIESAKVEVAQAAEDLGIEADDQFFDSLEAELEQGLRDPDEAIAKAAEQLDELADKAETEADRAERIRDDTAERLAELDPEEFSAARDLAEALASGDFNQAAQETEALQSGLEDPATRDELRRLADQLDQAANAGPPPAEPDQADQDRPDQLQNDLRDLADNLREQADAEPPAELSPPSDPSQPNDAQPSPPEERKPPSDPIAQDDTADPIAQDDTAPQDEQPQPDQQPDQQQDTQQNPQPQPSDQPEPGGEGEQQQDRDQQREQANEDSPAPQPNPEQPAEPSPQPGDQPGQQQQQDQRPGEQSAPDDQAPDQPQDQPAPEQPAQDQPGEPQPQPNQDQPGEPGQQPQPDPNAPDQPGQPSPNQPPQPTPGQPDPNAPPQPSPGNPDQPSQDGPATPTPGDEPAQSPAGQQPDQPNRPGTPSNDPNAEPTTLERLAQDQRRADDLRRFADDLRDRADKMLAEDSEGDQRPLSPDADAPGAGPLAPPADPWEAPTELVDARDQSAAEDARERVVSEWFKDPEGRPLDAAAPAEAREAIRRAARDAERAVEQQTVPRRYEDLVRRVFERYSRRTAEPAADARDASDASDAGDPE